MNYIVVVALVFANDGANGKKFDIWEVQTPVQADSPKKALLGAITRSKGFEDWKVLGYPREPLLYAIRSVHREPPFVAMSEEEHRKNRLPILVGSIDELQLRSLRSHNEIYLPYSFMHIG